MNPENVVRALCARHGLPPEAGAPYISLVEKALAAPDEVRDRLLTLVDGSLAQRAQGIPDEPAARKDVDHEVLMAVARTLHGWTPSAPMLDLGSKLGTSGPAPESA
jgi:hypothetical protein